ncbi:MAG: DUF6922 domain-containing protein [Polyangiales bacterium]
MPTGEVPEEVAKLFWDVDPKSVDLARHSDYVMERIMSRGGWAAMLWLRRAYSADELANFLLRRGARLAPRDLAYWCVVSGLKLPIPRGGGRPSWAGP